MVIDPNLSKWIISSVVKHFSDLLSPNIKVYFETEKRDTRTEKYIAEIRVDGPIFTSPSKGVKNIYIEVNILLQCIEDYEYMYKQHELLGIIQSAFTDIQVKKYGNKVGDDASFLFCLRLLQERNRNNRLITSNFGEVEPNSKLLQSTIEGHYSTYLLED